eukprot:gene7914-9292_t
MTPVKATPPPPVVAKKSTPTTPKKATPTTPKKTPQKKRKMDDDEDYQDDEEEMVSDDDYQFSDDDEDDAPKKRVVAAPIKRKVGASKIDKNVRYGFLVDIKDANMNPKGHPDYDPRTIYVPTQTLASFSPFEQQFWDIKRMHYDMVVFFKKGKFYELYENDADIGHEVFGLKMTDRVNMRMVGVPEATFATWAAKFIAAGYKVAKVDQTESHHQRDRRQSANGSGDKKDSIITRKLTSILTLGTLVDEALLTEASANYLMAIKEDEANRAYGVCFVDASVGRFFIATFEDDDSRSHLETLLLQTMPREVLIERGGTSSITTSVLKRVLRHKHLICARTPLAEFWEGDQTINHLNSALPSLPPAIEQARDQPLLLCALGAVFSYLDELKIGDGIIPQARFESYDPMDCAHGMVLDAQCLSNLEVFNNATDGSKEGTLFKVLDRCQTPFGKRLLKQWVCRPLSKHALIVDRLDAVAYLGSNPEVFDRLASMLNRLPDLERMVSRVHAKTSNIQDLTTLLNVFEASQGHLTGLEENLEEIQSGQLKHHMTIGKGYPDLTQAIEAVRTSYTYDKVTEKLEPRQGLFSEYDECRQKINVLEAAFEQHLQEQRKFFGAKVEYRHMGKVEFQLEVPAAALTRVKPPTEYIVKSTTKTAKRFYTPFVDRKLPELQEARDTLSILAKDVFLHIQLAFNASAALWAQAISCLATLDCVASLTRVSFQSSIGMCRPEILANADHTIFDVCAMRHPAITLQSGDDFIPNDLHLGTDEQHPGVLVLTGPNMGGKSTLLRQSCIVVLMAQLGCYVPAESARLSIVDRIFTRLGANDNIMAGQSTFMMELAETSTVLRHATRHSLVIMDELGRGTSTFDGYSIAYAVLRHIALTIRCACVFATHYQSLANEPGVRAQIATAHMSCHVDDNAKRVIFLYKLIEGVCPNSYGMHVGAMAGVPMEVIKLAEEKAHQFERESTISSYVHQPTVLHVFDSSHNYFAINMSTAVLGQFGDDILLLGGNTPTGQDGAYPFLYAYDTIDKQLIQKASTPWYNFAFGYYGGPQGYDSVNNLVFIPGTGVGIGGIPNGADTLAIFDFDTGHV